MKNEKIVMVLGILLVMLVLSLFITKFLLSDSSRDYFSEGGGFIGGDKSLNEERKIPNNFFFRKMDKGNGIVINIWIENLEIDVLKEHGMKYLFIDMGNTRTNGKLDTSENDINHFLEKIKDYEKDNNYNFIILPYSEINTYDYNFNNDNFKNNYFEDYLHFVELGFDGIYVDVEPIRDKKDYLNFLEDLKNKLPKDSILGVYSGSVSSSVFSSNEWEWDIDFFERVSDRVDLIFIPGFDSYIKDEGEYDDYIKFQVKELNKANLNSNLIFGIPTHNNKPETIDNALSAYVSQISESSKASNFIGVSIFAEWTTNNEEWRIFDEMIN